MTKTESVKQHFEKMKVLREAFQRTHGHLSMKEQHIYWKASRMYFNLFDGDHKWN